VVDLSVLVANARALAREPPAIWAVVKADAYGHGAVPVVRALADAGVAERFAVSLVEEAVELRAAGITAPILVLGPALAGGYRELAACDAIAVLSSEQDLLPLAAAGVHQGRPVTIHLKVDTGMGRLGIAPDRVLPLVEECKRTQGVRLTGLCTHFACADTDDPNDPDSLTRRQLRCFDSIHPAVRAVVGNELELHAANSAGLLRFPSSHYHAVRPGLALYGNIPGPGLRGVMSFGTEIVQLRQVPAGHTVSYGATWRAERLSRVAVLPVGYADGLPRNVSNRAFALVRGRRVPLCGVISMDISLADVTDLGDNVAVGDRVILFGSQDGAQIEVAELARNAGITEYEVTCGISKRVPREYV
jgi:alanine racemase